MGSPTTHDNLLDELRADLESALAKADSIGAKMLGIRISDALDAVIDLQG